MKSLAVVSVFILIISTIFYYFLGGFNPVEYSIHDDESYIVIGREYQGKNNSSELEQLYSETRKLISMDYTNGTLVIINDENNYDSEKGEVGYFIGIALNKRPDLIPKGFIFRELEGMKIVRARIESHNFVMPKPDKIRSKAIAMASDAGFELSEITIEKYIEQGVIEVDFLSRN